jgi:hypothetical protein
MKTEKQIQEEVWEHISIDKTMKEMWSIPELQDGIKYIIESVVTKTIELVINDIQEKLSKTDLINVKSYDEGYATGYVEGMGKGVHTEAYIEGYEASLKELKSNVLKDSTAAIINKNGYEKGCNECADRISEIVWCSDTLDRIREIVKELTKK